MLQPSNPVSSQPTLVTLSDAITDSPVYRAKIYHFDEQVKLLEAWLESLSKQMKGYCEKLNKFNLETNELCKKVMLPTGIDDSLIDPNFAGAIISSFSDALQKSLAFKTKLVSQIEDGFIQPLQQFVEKHLKTFKTFRKDHEKALERYEVQLAKYAEVHKEKEASAVREEAFRLHKARESYARMSGQHVLRILHFRSVLEHALVEQFASVTLSHLQDFDGDTLVWRNLESSLASWKQWLVDDKDTCDYQLHKLHLARVRLEKEYIKSISPSRDIKKYEHDTSPQSPLTGPRPSLDQSHAITGEDESASCKKWGYLFFRNQRGYWSRRWFFLCNGYFGYCNHSPATKGKGTIAMVERESVLLCDIKPITDASRRFCFEVVRVKNSLVLQAETEEDMRQWISTFTAARHLSVGRSVLGDTSPQEAHPDVIASPVPSEHRYRPSIVVLSTSPDNNDESLTKATSLTSLLAWEAATSRLQTPYSSRPSVSTPAPKPVTSNSTSWGIPWTLMPSMFQSTTEDDAVGATMSSAGTDSDGQSVWPPRAENANIAKVELTGYDTALNTRNRELRRLFGGVATHEIVLDAFIGSLKKTPTDTEESTHDPPKTPLSPTTPSVSTVFDEREEKFNSTLAEPVKAPSSTFGHSYTGRVFLTQETFWFYSCVLMTCVNTVAIRLKDIKAIRLIRDSSIKNTGNKSNTVLAIDLVDHERTAQSPLILTTLMDDIELVAEKLRMAVDNAKSPEPNTPQLMYDILHSLSKVISKRKSRQQDVKLSSSEPTKAKSTPDLHATAAAQAAQKAQESPTHISSPEEPITSPTPSKKKKSPSFGSQPTNKGPLQPKSGALAAAMMAATVAGGSSFFDVSKMARVEDDPRPSSKRTQKIDSPPSTDAKKGETTKLTTARSSDIDASSVKSSEKIPAHIQIPTEPVSCECKDHLEIMHSEVEIPVSAKKLYEIMWSEERTGQSSGGGIWKKKALESKCEDLHIGSWDTVDGKLCRHMKYIMPVDNPMVKVKEAEVVETQKVLEKDEYIRYVVQISTKTAALPYADAFIPSIRYCITWVDETHCKLSCRLGVEFLKSIMIKRLVKKAAMDGMAKSLTQFLPIIENEATQGRALSTSAKTGATAHHHHESTKSAKRSSLMAMVTNKDTDKESWWSPCVEALDTLWSIFNDLPSSMRIGLAIAGALCLMWMLRAGTHYDKRHSASQAVATNGSIPMVVSKAVYLKDLEEVLLGLDLQPATHVHPDSFHIFLQSKSVATEKLEERYKWFNPRHHQFSVELLFSRERIAMLRHDALVIFRMLNRVDTQLLENEYLNWLLDTRQRCQDALTSSNALQCEQVFLQLQDMVSKSDSRVTSTTE